MCTQACTTPRTLYESTGLGRSVVFGRGGLRTGRGEETRVATLTTENLWYGAHPVGLRPKDRQSIQPSEDLGFGPTYGETLHA